MELYDLENGMRSIAGAGHVLNCQELIGLQAGLAALKSAEKYREIFLWGKIFAEERDYYIAYGLGPSEFEFPTKVFFYALEGVFDFRPLQRLTEAVADAVIELNLDGPFSGNPRKELSDTGAAPMTDEEGVPKPTLYESDRLAQAVQEIDFDTAVVPKGAYALNETDNVVPSSNFKGLQPAHALSLSHYVHFRPPTSAAALRTVARNDAEFYANFLDTLDGDLPKGCWAIRRDSSVDLVTLRSLSWPGYVGFHHPRTRRFGGLYFGYAQKCRDLPFIL